MKHRWITWIVLLALVGGLLPSGNLESVGAQDSSSTSTLAGNASEVAEIRFENMDRFSPNGDELVYVTAQTLGMRESKIWISDADGTNARIVIAGENDIWVTNPVWSPDGDRIAYLKITNVPGLQGVDSIAELWIINVRNGASKQVLDSTDFQPALGYGGQADVFWVSDNEIEYADHKTFPATRYRVDIDTNTLQTVRQTSQPMSVMAQPSDVPCFSQHDTDWACDQLGYDPNWTMGVCPDKPGTSSGGCVVTSVAMALKYFGIDTDPGRLNQWLKDKDNDGFAEGTALIRWHVAASIDSSISHTYIDNQDWDRLKAELDAGYPVILRVTGHSVLATGYSGDTVYINDTGATCKRTLAAYNNTFFNMHIYRGNLPTSDKTPPTINFTTPTQNQWYNTDQTLSWTITDDLSGVDYYKWAWNTTPPNNRVNSSSGSTRLSVPGQGRHTLYVQAWDKAGNATAVQSRGWFGYDTVAPNTTITSGPSGCIATNNVSFQWTGTDAQTPTADLQYRYKLDGLSNWSAWSSSTSRTYTNLPDNAFTFQVQARDMAGNVDASPASRSFTVSANMPVPPANIQSNCEAQNNVWQSVCNAPEFTWHPPNEQSCATVTGYAYEWYAWEPVTGTLTLLDSGATNTTNYTPPLVTDGIYKLRLRTQDSFNRWSAWGDSFTFRYDSTPPTATIAINNGAATTYQTSVQVHLSAEDVGSGVADVRLSHNGFAWADWQPYADVVAWGLPALNRREIPVYAQVRDRAGNLSSVVSATIMLDLYPVAPHSAGFRICADVINVGGSVGLTSTGFSLISAIGQPWQTGPVTSTSRQGASGFLADLHSCRPISHTVTADLNLHSWVIASGGNLRSSAGFRLGDTAGQPAASGTNAFSSTSYILSSGFWGNMIAPACPAPLTGVRVTGPATGTVNMALTFTAHFTPIDATTPLTYTWTSEPESGQGAAQAVYQWATAGARTITATVENCGGSFSAAHTVDIQEPPAPVCETPLTGVTVTGPITGVVDTLLNFEVAITPEDATRPIAFTWTPAPESGQGTTQAAYRYQTAGEQTISVTAAHCDGAVTASDTTTVSVLLAPPMGFGVSINDGARYTNDPHVTVRTWAPGDITEMRLSNDGAYSNEGWQTYQERVPWEIEPYGNYVLPRTVHVWFKNAQNQVFGSHTDDIIYDPVPPTGSVGIQQRDGNQVTLRLTATDDHSGVATMRLGGNENLSGSAWQPFAEIATLTLSGDVAYAQFQDHAGNVSRIYASDGSSSTDQQHIYLPLVIRNH